jgi:TonB family protein
MTDTRHGKKLVLVVVIAFLPVIALGPAKAKPLTQTQVLGLLRGEVAPVRVAQLALEKGIDFTLSPDDEKRLRRAGADAALIETLRALAPKAVAPEPMIKLFTADPTSLSPSAPSTMLSWSVSDAMQVTIDPDIGRVDLIGHVSVSPAKTTTYTLYATRAGGGDLMKSITVEVIPVEIVINNFEVDDARIQPSQHTHLRWSVSNATSVTIDSGNHALSVASEGVWSISPAATTTYLLQANGNGPSHFRRVTVEVENPPQQDASALLARANLFRSEGRYADALELYRQVAILGDPDGMCALGLMYRDGLGVAKDYAEARDWFSIAEGKGNAAASNEMGWLYQNGWGVAQNYNVALREYRESADAGNAAAMYNIGAMHENGWGVLKDYSQAMEWYRKAATAGNNGAIRQEGLLFENGWGVATDYAEAMNFYRAAAAAGDGKAMDHVGDLFYNGFGVAQDYLEAMNWYRKAADAGNGAAMSNIGWLNQNGLGVNQDYAEAMTWYRKAADAGVANAMNNIGWLYEHGLGVDADREAAVSWYRKAAGAGNGNALKNLKRLGVDVDRSDAGTPHRIRVGGNVQAANLIRKVVPVYPPLAAQARVQGTVRFQAVIGENGAIQNLQLVSGHPMLVESARQAVSQWLYKPTLLNGQPVEVVTTIDVNFTLSQ